MFCTTPHSTHRSGAVNELIDHFLVAPDASETGKHPPLRGVRLVRAVLSCLTPQRDRLMMRRAIRAQFVLSTAIALATLASAALLCSRAAEAPVAPPALLAKVDFNRDVQPLLSDRCYFCHGPDASKRKAKL